MATMSREEIAQFVSERWNDGWRETLLQIAANANEARHSEAAILEIAEIENPRLRDLELRKLIMREHSKDFHERDLLLVLAETQIDIAICLERIFTELSKESISERHFNEGLAAMMAEAKRDKEGQQK